MLGGRTAPSSERKSVNCTRAFPISSAVHSNSCAETLSPFQPINLSLSVGIISGATDFGNRLSMDTKEACSPDGTPDQSDSVSAVGSGSSVKVSETRLSVCVHAMHAVNNKPQRNSSTCLEFVISFLVLLRFNPLREVEMRIRVKFSYILVKMSVDLRSEEHTS